MPDERNSAINRGHGCGCSEGPQGFCFCPACGHRAPHEPGVPCREVSCPRCGAALRREGKAFGQSGSAVEGA
jgi:hypothetical protein